MSDQQAAADLREALDALEAVMGFMTHQPPSGSLALRAAHRAADVLHRHGRARPRLPPMPR